MRRGSEDLTLLRKMAAWPLAWRQRLVSQHTPWKVIKLRNTSLVATWPFGAKFFWMSRVLIRLIARRGTMSICAGDFNKPATGSLSHQRRSSGIIAVRILVLICG